MNFDSLLLATLTGTPAAYMFARHKAPRTRSILAGVTAFFLIAGIPPLLAAIGHPVAAGWTLLGIVAGFILCALLVWHDIIKGEHNHQMFGGRKAIAGAGPSSGGGSGKKHHARPLLAAVGLVVFAMMVAINWSVIAGDASHGFGQSVTSVTNHRGA